MMRTIARLTLGIFMSTAMLAPFHAAHAGDFHILPYPPQNGGFDQQYQQGPDRPHGSWMRNVFDSRNWTGRRIAKIALSAAGGVVGGLFGSQFGMVGTVVGGAAGFLVSRWIGDKIFGHSGHGHGWGHGGGQWNQGPWNQGGNPGWQGPVPPPHFSGTVPGGSTDVAALRDAFQQAYDNFMRAAAKGNPAEKEAARNAFEAARDAYFRAKSGN